MTVQRFPVYFSMEQKRCKCGADMKCVETLRVHQTGKAHYKHICTAPGCDLFEWLEEQYPRLLVFRDTEWHVADQEPDMILYPRRGM